MNLKHNNVGESGGGEHINLANETQAGKMHRKLSSSSGKARARVDRNDLSPHSGPASVPPSGTGPV